MTLIEMVFAGVPSGRLGIYVKSHRVVSAPSRRRQIAVPGVDGLLDAGPDGYDNIGIAVDLAFGRRSVPELRDAARRLGAWLSQTGELFFTDEPNARYADAHAYEQVVLDQILASGTCSVTFDAKPIAYGARRFSEADANSALSVTLPIDYQGSAPSCPMIVIKNQGTTDLKNLRLTTHQKQGGMLEWLTRT